MTTFSLNSCSCCIATAISCCCHCHFRVNWHSRSVVGIWNHSTYSFLSPRPHSIPSLPLSLSPSPHLPLALWWSPFPPSPLLWPPSYPSSVALILSFPFWSSPDCLLDALAHWGGYMVLSLCLGPDQILIPELGEIGCLLNTLVYDFLEGLIFQQASDDTGIIEELFLLTDRRGTEWRGGVFLGSLLSLINQPKLPATFSQSKIYEPHILVTLYPISPAYIFCHCVSIVYSFCHLWRWISITHHLLYEHPRKI